MAITFNPDDGSYTDGITTLTMTKGDSGVYYEIGTLAQLKLFRDAVNAGNSFSGQTVKLMDSFDLNNEEWTPIGKDGAVFQGTFDGNRQTISNLKITKELDNTSANCGIGFFGYTNSPAGITNLTIDNVDITGSLYVGAIVGYGFTGAEISNCHVTGQIEIEGWWYIGGIGGNGYVSKVDNCTVTGDEGSYIKALNNGSYVGGIWGYRGEGNMTISDCSVDDIDISGYDRIGGICGIAHYGNTIEECSISNSSITAENDIGNVGLIAGANLGDTEHAPAVLLNNTADTGTSESFTIKEELVSDPPMLGENDNTGNPGKAAIIGDVTLNDAGEITGGTLTVVGTEKNYVDVSDALSLADGNPLITQNDDGTIDLKVVATDALLVNPVWASLDPDSIVEYGGQSYKVGTNAFGTIEAAVKAAGTSAGNTIVLLDDITLSSKLELSKNLEFDLNGFTLDGAVSLSGDFDVTFRNGTMTAAYTSTTGNVNSVINVSGSSGLTLDGVTLTPADTRNEGQAIHAIYYKSSGALNIVNSTVSGGSLVHDENYTSGTKTAANAIYAHSESGGTIRIENSTITGGAGRTDAVYSGSYQSGLYVEGGEGVALGGSAEVLIVNSTVLGGDSDWLNAGDAIDVTSTFNGTLTVSGSSKISGGDALDLSGETSRGIGGCAIYVNQSTGCTQIVVTDSELIGGDGGHSWNGSALELNTGVPAVTITNSTLTVGQGENSDGNAGAIRVNLTDSLDLNLDGVTLNGDGNDNKVFKITSTISNGGISLAGENTISGGTLEDVAFRAVAAGTTIRTTDGGTVNSGTISPLLSAGDDGFQVQVTTTAETLLVSSSWADLADGSIVPYNGENYEIGMNAFADISDAAATDVSSKILVIDGSYSGDQYFNGHEVEIGTADAAVDFGTGYVFGGALNENTGDINLKFVNGSAGRIYGAATNADGDYETGSITLNIGEDVTVSGRIAAGKVDAGSLTTGDVEINYAGNSAGSGVALFGGAQAWYVGSSTTHESVTINISGELTDVVYAAGQAMHGGWVTVKNGVTTNVTGGSIGTDGLMGGGFSRSDISETDTAGGITIEGGTWINISGGEISDVYGGTHTYSLNGQLEVVSTITGGTHITMTDGEVGNVQGGGYTAWGSKATIDSTYVSVSGGTVYGDVQGGSYVVGGGKDVNSGNSSTITNGTTVVISGDADIQGSVYGGSWVNWATGTAASYIGGASTVVVEGGQIAGNVAGGGVTYANSGDGTTSTLISESDSTEVTLTGGTIKGSVIGGGVSIDGYNKGAALNNSVSNTSVVINGATVEGSVIAGGYAQGVNTTTSVTGGVAVEIKSGTIMEDVYGGSLGGSIGGDSTISISGGDIQGGVYGADVTGTITGDSKLSFDNEGDYTTDITVVQGFDDVSFNGGTVTFNNVTFKDSVIYISNDALTPGSRYTFAAAGNITFEDTASFSIGGEDYKLGEVTSDGFVLTYDGTDFVVGEVTYDTTVLAVNSTWSSLGDGTGVEAGGNFYVIGSNAFDNVAAAIAKATDQTETIALAGGVFSGSQYFEGYAAVIGVPGTTLEIDGSVYGGGASDITGNTSVTIQGGTITGDVYAGGSDSNVAGDAVVTLTGGTVGGSIYGTGEGSGTVGTSTLNLGAASDAELYTTTLSNVYGFDTANIVNANVTVTADFAAEQIRIADATLTLNSGFNAATENVTIDLGNYNKNAAALVLGQAAEDIPTITLTATSALTESRYLIAEGISDTAFTLDASLRDSYILRTVDGSVYLYDADAPAFTTELSVTQAEGSSVDGKYSFTANFEAEGLLSGYTVRIYDSETATTPDLEIPAGANADQAAFELSNTTSSFWISVTATGENGISTDSGRIEYPVTDYDNPEILQLAAEVTTIGVSLTCQATDNFGVTGYEFFLDGQSLGIQSGEQYYLDGNLLDIGQHTYSVKAYDAAGNQVESETALFDFKGVVAFLYSSLIPVNNGESMSVYAYYSDAAAPLEYRLGNTGDWTAYDAETGVNVKTSTEIYFRVRNAENPVETAVDVTVVPMPEDVSVNSEVIHLAPAEDTYYEATYVLPDGSTEKTVELSGNTVEHYALPEDTKVTIVEKDPETGDVVNTIVEETPVASTTSEIPDKVVAVDDGHDNLFFAISIGKWDGTYIAQHQGDGVWGGTMEFVSTKGKNRFSTVFEGGEDATTLFLTDDANGDVFFLDDVYTVNGSDARISKMTEIQAGLGDDIVDLSSAKFSYVEHSSGELIVRGGDGNDILWGNAGHNILFGDDGNDKLYGGSNDDILTGGIGNDIMHGGGGNDIFCYGSSYDWGNDTITQLASGSVTLYLDGIDRNDCTISGNKLTWDDGTFSGSIALNGVSWDSVKFYCAANGDGLLAEIAEYDDLKNKGAFAAVSSH